jgi:Conserved hypothetical protein 2217 (DUF2460)
MTAAPLITFPTLPGLEFPVSRSNLGFNVVKQESLSGNRTRFPQRSVPLYRWEISFSVLRDKALPVLTPFSDLTTFSDGTEFSQPGIGELLLLAGFYNMLNGATLPFLWTEANDSQAVAQQFGVGDGATTQFQLTRTWGGFTEPVYGSPQVADIAVGTTTLATNAYTVSVTGLVTFAAPPLAAAPLIWSGTYQWLCRFDEDNLDFSQFMSGLWDLKKLTFSNEILP